MTGKQFPIEVNACSNGEEYEIQAIFHPSRILISVIKCRDCDMPTVSVKTDKEIPKDIMGKLRDIEVDSPIDVGDVIVENVLGT